MRSKIWELPFTPTEFRFMEGLEFPNDLMQGDYTVIRWKVVKGTLLKLSKINADESGSLENSILGSSKSPMNGELVRPDQAFLKTLKKDGVIRSESPSFRMLTGGVSSEIYKVEDGRKVFVIKRALSKLKVTADWYANVSRNAYEVAFLDYTSNFIPESVPQIIGRGDGYFVMEFIDGDIKNWKELLLAGICNQEHSRRAGEILGEIHAYSFQDEEAEKLFDSSDNFIQLRIAPYLFHIAEKYPSIKSMIQREGNRLAKTRECLIHGDFSPKNILISPSRMVLVDCEVAFYGDSSFDVAFLLSHLLLKDLFHRNLQLELRSLCAIFLSAYQKKRSSQLQQSNASETCVARLLLMLLLARVDGKSPVEYLDETKKKFVRYFTLDFLTREKFDLEGLLESWFERNMTTL